ncbi:hypothetical protein DFP73DRAFT_556218 [Morchella snyderi]|nr:hypothetical protein DFP73DRAFT_556218 [Morchella snyderi]
MWPFMRPISLTLSLLRRNTSSFRSVRRTRWIVSIVYTQESQRVTPIGVEVVEMSLRSPHNAAWAVMFVGESVAWVIVEKRCSGRDEHEMSFGVVSGSAHVVVTT